MEDAALLKKLFEYDLWANREALRSVATVPGDTEPQRKILSHIMGAHRLWQARILGEDTAKLFPFALLAAEELRSALEAAHQRWTAFLATRTPEHYAAEVNYKDTKGNDHTTPLRDILLHLVNHSTYHRGQVAVAVRQAEGKPAPTDYVVYLRHLAATSS